MSSDFARVISWTQPTAASNVSIDVYLDSVVGPAKGEAFLMNAIGPTATPANQIAFTQMSAPELGTFNILNLNTAPSVQLFSGLNLTAGTYYLVLLAPYSSNGVSWNWLGDSVAKQNFAPGWTLGTYSFTDGPLASYVPASKFDPTGLGHGSYRYFFDVTSIAAPEPIGISLIAVGSLVLVAACNGRATIR